MRFLKLTQNRKILFVCESNLICSPLAAAIAQHLFGAKYSISFDSAGVFAGNSTRLYDRRIVKVANEKGIPFERAKLKQLDSELLQECNAVFYLNEEAHFHIKDMIPNSKIPLYMLSEFYPEHRNQPVPDPIQLDVSFEYVFDFVYPLIESIEVKLDV